MLKFVLRLVPRRINSPLSLPHDELPHYSTCFGNVPRKTLKRGKGFGDKHRRSLFGYVDIRLAGFRLFSRLSFYPSLMRVDRAASEPFTPAFKICYQLCGRADLLNIPALRWPGGHFSR